MTIPLSVRLTSNESRYVPALFQHGEKVLVPVHGYGYVDLASNPYAVTTKKIYMKHLTLLDMFTVGQRVGVCVSHIYVGRAATGALSIDDVSHLTAAITIGDGVNSVTFTAEGDFAIGATGLDSLTNLAAAINAVGAGLTVTAGTPSGTGPWFLVLTNDSVGAAGNVLITLGGDTTHWACNGMSNGEDAGEPNHWSDGTIESISEDEKYIEVALDNPIGIARSGESVIDFIAETTVGEDKQYFSCAHLWQTADAKSYVTALDIDILDKTSHLYTPSNQVMSRIFLACYLDKYLPKDSISLCSERYFLVETNGGVPVWPFVTFLGKYFQYCGTPIPFGASYEKPSLNYHEGEYTAYQDAVAPAFWDRHGHADGTTIMIYDEQEVAKETWYKDRSFLFGIRGEETAAPIDGMYKSYNPASVVYVSNPFNVENDLFASPANPHRFVIAAPSKVDEVPLPIDTNFWCHGQIDGDPNAFICDFRPAIDDQGMPYIKNVGNTGLINTTGDETICVYDNADMISDRFTNNTYDVFVSGKTSNIDMYVGGQTSIDKFTLDIGIAPDHLDEIFNYAVDDGVGEKIERATYPVMLSKMNVVSSAAPSSFTRSVGSWDDVEYFNGQIWFASSNVLKPTNAVLEFDPVNSLETPSAIIGLKALANQLFVMTETGIYTVNTKNELEFLSSIVAKMWSAVGESLYLVDEKGSVYNTEFTPIPVQDKRRSTDNPYMVLAVNTLMIQDVAEQWTVFDIKSCHDMLWVASNMGLWAIESSTKAWFKVSNDVFLHLVNAGNEIFGITGRKTVSGEMESIDLYPLVTSEKIIL